MSISTNFREVFEMSIAWEFNKAAHTVQVVPNYTGNERAFSFELVRHKDVTTHEEGLTIKSLYNGKDNGSIETSVYNLEKDIESLKRYGVAINALAFRDLRKVIEDNYLDLPITPVSVTSGNQLQELVEQVKDYVEMGKKDLVADDFCHIPVSDFTAIAEDCGYHQYEMQSLRSTLAKGKYIHTQAGRYAVLARIKGKPTRVIAFYRDKLGISAPEDKQQLQSEKSGADE
jgi:hypothetical protein